MSAPNCTHCGIEVASELGPGLCPACLLESAMTGVGGGGPAASASIGRIGDYELVQEIARGGQGVVFRARHTKLQREVALKLLPFGAWTAPAQMQRWQTEARIVAGLDHPAIVPIYEMGETEGQHFFAMKLIDGLSLNRLPPEQLPPPREAAALVAQAARAIHYAHERGVLHRDLKPGNILLDRQGRPHITDFGLAKWRDDDSALTLSTEMLGTPSYISPEMAVGGPQAAGTAADIYGLGAVFFYLLTGRAPFAGSTSLETLRQVIETDPPAPRALNPALDRDLESICLRCLEKTPTRRYASAAALAEDLERALRGEPVLARPAGRWYRARKWLRRHRAAAAGMVALLAVGALVAWLVGVRSPEIAGDLARVEQLIAALDAVPDDLQLAEDIMQGVLARQPADPTALIMMARVQGMFPYRGVDRSDARFATVRRYAERAVQLAPDDPGALSALALYHYTHGNDSARARAVIERAIALRPADPFLHRLHVAILVNSADVPAPVAIAAAEQNAARFPDDALVQYQLAQFYRDDGRLAEMETCLDRAIAAGPVPNALMWKAQAALWLRGDVAEMGTWLDRVSPRIRTTERVALARWAQAMAGGSYADGLSTLERLPQAWIEDWSFVGPKHLLTGQLWTLAGEPVRARLDFEHALDELGRQQVREPSEADDRRLRVWILLGLGRLDEARAIFRDDVLPTVRRPYRPGPLTSWWFQVVPCALLLGERGAALDLISEAVSPVPFVSGDETRRVSDYEVSPRATAAEVCATLRLRMRLDPRMAPWRTDPEITVLLSAPAVHP